MKGKQVILLFLALLLPSALFVFLRTFGKNEFQVPPLYQDSVTVSGHCNGYRYTTPYHLADSVLTSLFEKDDSLVCVAFSAAKDEKLLKRVKENYVDAPLGYKLFTSSRRDSMKECIFLLPEPFDVALVDREGTIRGQYDANDREEIDRLITEIAIILKKY
jgi:hypothetical protein